jgi:putative tricarboxylic transport membrane protein
MTRYLKDGDLLSGAVLAVLAAYIINASSQWTILGPEGPGPGFFPLGYGVLMLGCSLALIVAALVRRQAVEEAADPAGTAAAFVTWGALAASVPLMWAFGFVVGFGIVIFFIVRFVFERTLLGSAITAAAVVLALHLVFPVLLGSALPVGLWWNF